MDPEKIALGDVEEFLRRHPYTPIRLRASPSAGVLCAIGDEDDDGSFRISAVTPTAAESLSRAITRWQSESCAGNNCNCKNEERKK